jgi:hypothetical protein
MRPYYPPKKSRLRPVPCMTCGALMAQPMNHPAPIFCERCAPKSVARPVRFKRRSATIAADLIAASRTLRRDSAAEARRTACTVDQVLAGWWRAAGEGGA